MGEAASFRQQGQAAEASQEEEEKELNQTENNRDDCNAASVYPRLDRKKRRAVRRIFFFGLLHPDAMHHSIWGVNEGAVGASPVTLREADEAASVAHDYVWGLNSVTEQEADSAIWRIHNALRPLIDPSGSRGRRDPTKCRSSVKK